jgi:hypothetical protein
MNIYLYTLDTIGTAVTPYQHIPEAQRATPVITPRTRGASPLQHLLSRCCLQLLVIAKRIWSLPVVKQPLA